MTKKRRAVTFLGRSNRGKGDYDALTQIPTESELDMIRTRMRRLTDVDQSDHPVVLTEGDLEIKTKEAKEAWLVAHDAAARGH